MATKYAPTINRPRNKFKMPHEVGTTFDAGLCIPLEWQEVLPGDHVSKKVSYIVRMLTPKRPVMDNCFLNISAFFVPYEIIWNQWKNFMGENDVSAWTESNTYLVPAATGINPGGSPGVGTIGDYLGLPTGSMIAPNTRISLLPLRGYLAIWNYWYRSENLQDPILFTKESADYVAASYGKYYSDYPLPSQKLPDYFTTCLPDPSKITPVELNPTSPVLTGTSHSVAGVKMSMVTHNGASLGSAGGAVTFDTSGNLEARSLDAGLDSEDVLGSLVPGNLWANNASLTIETIRRAAVYQHVGEILARGGSRYASEFLVNIFGVQNSESLFSEPEFLGSIDRLVNMTEVLSNAQTLQTNEGGAQTGAYLGANGGMSKTTGSEYLFEHTFSRHGMIFCIATIRARATYFQGLEKKWTRSSFFDFYLPQAQGLGYQKVLKKEIYSSANTATDNQVFGYQDYGAEYRYQPNKLTGYMKPNVTGALADWTYAQVFGSSPVLGPSFIAADKTGIDRTIALQSSEHPSMQFFGNFLFDDEWIRVVGVQRFPGLDVI